MLESYTFGTKTAAPPILIAHGLFGSARNWNVIAKRLSETRFVITVDMRNHGASPWNAPHDYPAMAGDLAEIIAKNGGQADVVGHSMGGKAAMVLALNHPETLRKLVVADIAPVAYGHTQQGMIDAMRTVDLPRVETRGDADRQLAAEIEEPGVRAFLLQSLDVKAKRWRLNLDQLEADMGAVLGFPEVESCFEGPVLMLSGGESDYVLPEHRERVKALFPAARFAKIPGAGHWLHAEKPREFEAAVAAFLAA
ncbi:alpha/beta fold hydrolase [Gymnodinialimonas ceratoperidinii]|uniref:Alpha/beta fold hydrolase n=1 Tax=Gymnodinialimonas ceratoperidinii TaxID=2856823 RepID=A0A8F6TXX5_9RHOB|nr:alpha/beta fold hydrolase [Gymnodinialimonas ceratoperidinii]QXT40700.1 alpha/beta fold hydrolase [Gymnodinialimonas ceratoperidinii]